MSLYYHFCPLTSHHFTPTYIPTDMRSDHISRASGVTGLTWSFSGFRPRKRPSRRSAGGAEHSGCTGGSTPDKAPAAVPRSRGVRQGTHRRRPRGRDEPTGTETNQIIILHTRRTASNPARRGRTQAPGSDGRPRGSRTRGGRPGGARPQRGRPQEHPPGQGGTPRPNAAHHPIRPRPKKPRERAGRPLEAPRQPGPNPPPPCLPIPPRGAGGTSEGARRWLGARGRGWTRKSRRFTAASRPGHEFPRPLGLPGRGNSQKSDRVPR